MILGYWHPQTRWLWIRHVSDLIYAQKDGDGASLVNRIESLNGLHTLEYAEQIGLGSRTYRLISVDE